MIYLQAGHVCFGYCFLSSTEVASGQVLLCKTLLQLLRPSIFNMLVLCSCHMVLQTSNCRAPITQGLLPYSAASANVCCMQQCTNSCGMLLPYMQYTVPFPFICSSTASHESSHITCHCKEPVYELLISAGGIAKPPSRATAKHSTYWLSCCWMTKRVGPAQCFRGRSRG